MKRILGVMILAACASAAVRADEPDPKAVLDKAIEALGGEEKLNKALAGSTWKTKGKLTLGGNESEFDGSATAKGLDHYRSEFSGEIGGSRIEGVTVLAGDKAWRKFNDMSTELEGDMLANEKRTVYLQAVSATIVPLKGKGFKVEAAGEDKVGGRPATVLKVTAPDGKDFKLAFDKETGLPVRSTAVVAGFMGEEFTQETTFSEYKTLDGIKKATKAQALRDGEPFVSVEVVEFKILDKIDADTFAEPK